MTKKTATKMTTNGRVREKSFPSIAALMGYDTPSNLNLDNPADQLKAYADVSWVYACVSRINIDIAGLPWDILERKGDDKNSVKSHPLRSLLIKPNENQSWSDLAEWWQGSLDLNGNFYGGLDKSVNPTSIFPMISSLTKPVPDTTKNAKYWVKKYKYGVNSVEVDFDREMIIHSKYFNSLPSGYYLGLSPLSAARMAVETDVRASEWNLSVIKNYAVPEGALTTDQKNITQEQRRLILDSWNMKYKGGKNARRTALLWNGFKYEPFGIPPKDMEFLLQRKMTREELLAIYKVPPAVLGLFEYANYANAEQQEKFYWQNCIIPRLRKMEWMINNRLLPLFSGKQDVFFEFDLTGVEVLQANEEKKSVIAYRLWTMGVPYNSIAEAMDLPVKKIPGGDVGYLPFSVIAVGSTASGGGNTKPDDNTTTSGKLIDYKPKYKLTEDAKRLKWEKFDKATRDRETKWKPVINEYFNGQEARVKANIANYRSLKELKKGIKWLIGDLSVFNALPAGQREIAISVRQMKAYNGIIFDEDDEIERLLKEFKPLYLQTIKEQAEQEIDNFGFSIAFDVTNPRVTAWILNHGGENIKKITNTTLEKLRATLAEGVEAGESIDVLSQRVADTYNSFRDYRTERIARTEVIGASNEGNLETYRQTGLNLKKGWLATYDDRTRDTHAAAGKQYDDAGAIPIDLDFVVDTGKGPAPGQMGSAEEDINCRCSVYPVLAN